MDALIKRNRRLLKQQQAQQQQDNAVAQLQELNSSCAPSSCGRHDQENPTGDSVSRRVWENHRQVFSRSPSPASDGGYDGCASASSSSTYYGRNSSCSSPPSFSGGSSLDGIDEVYWEARYQARPPETGALGSAYIPSRNTDHSMSYTSSGDDDYFLGTTTRFVQIPFSVDVRTTRRSSATNDCPFLSIGVDIMAQLVSFLEPPEILHVITMPLCKEWQRSFTSQNELWKVLCLLEPFKTNINEDPDDFAADEPFCALKSPYGSSEASSVGRYRLMYTSFVRCINYLQRIKDDTQNGRSPSVIGSGGAGFPHFGVSKSLREFLSRARTGNKPSKRKRSHEETNSGGFAALPIGVADDGTSTSEDTSRNKAASFSATKKAKFGHSIITQRLLGPSVAGDAGHVTLPRSCAIYSIVNWMVAFTDVEGIQTMCLKALPGLMEDEQQRQIAQTARLADVVIRAMQNFKDSVELHTAAFHTFVLLARPLGGREGMLFHNSGDLNDNEDDNNQNPTMGGTRTGARIKPSQQGGNKVITVLLDSMNRFRSEAKLQAMACWAMVNIALAPVHKSLLIRLGGIQAIADAMRQHPHNSDVQFRALFALINLVIPKPDETSTTQNNNASVRLHHEGYVAEEEDTEQAILARQVGDLATLVVLAMKNFCTSETILNRACLVIHNLTQSPEHVHTILWTPHCYQMLEWCITNHPTDPVLRRSAASARHRLEVSLSSDPSMRARFAASIRAGQELCLRQARADAQKQAQRHC